MKRPGFKCDANSGVLRWYDAEGHPQLASTRALRFMGLAARATVAGTGRDFEARKITPRGRTKWHPIELSFEEAVAYLGASWATKNDLEHAIAIRDRRIARGSPLTNGEDE